MKNGRIATFSSSQNYRLMSYGRGAKTVDNVGAPFHTYVKEKLREQRLGRPISNGGGKAAEWGDMMERWYFENKIDIKYKLVSKERYYHDELLWSGMPDLLLGDFVEDIKNPWTITAFCDLVDSFERVETFKKNHSNYYWQLVSNAILTGAEFGVIRAHMPYIDELQSIRDFAADHDLCAWLNYMDDDELPYLLRGKHYKDDNHFDFKIPEVDKQLMTARVLMANEEMISKKN